MPPRRCAGVLAAFAAVVLADSTSIEVHTHTRAPTGELLEHRITGERFADSKAFGVDWSAAGVLFLFDRGIPSASMWWRIHLGGGFFPSRLPGRYWPQVVDENRRHRGRARRLFRRDLRSAAATLKRSVIDVDCAFSAHVRGYGVKNGRFEWPHLRVVGRWNPAEPRHLFHLTHDTPEKSPAEVISEVYRLRWEVELFDRVCEGALGLDELHTTTPHIVETLVRSAVIRAAVAMRARTEAERALPTRLGVEPGGRDRGLAPGRDRPARRPPGHGALDTRRGTVGVVCRRSERRPSTSPRGRPGEKSAFVVAHAPLAITDAPSGGTAQGRRRGSRPEVSRMNAVSALGRPGSLHPTV